MPPTRLLSAGARVGSTRTSSLVKRTVCTGRQASFAAASTVSAAGPGGRTGANGFAAADLASVGRQVEQDRQQLGAGCPIDRRVMDLGIDRGAPPESPVMR